jgi:hypothetical protein
LESGARGSLLGVVAGRFGLAARGLAARFSPRLGEAALMFTLPRWGEAARAEGDAARILFCRKGRWKKSRRTTLTKGARRLTSRLTAADRHPS